MCSPAACQPPHHTTDYCRDSGPHSSPPPRYRCLLLGMILRMTPARPPQPPRTRQ
ncbi:hypothetical protein E2C01_081299 [Portunus trituberculatus]|uniref:Uncharacterized protein n=1 Tax=Portunus trituberculatus TaxID=210409 RepID=A0A5B7IPD9_PORTR|nr:hypothetical protein [Portunus trituberculatus]